MGTEVLRPQDVLGGERFRVPRAPSSFHRRRNNGNHLANLVVHNNNQRKYNNNNNNNYHRKTSPRSDKRKNADNNSNSNSNRNKPTSPKGQVTLLKRGESLDSLTSKINGGKTGSTSPKPMRSQVQKPVDDLAVCGTGRLGPELPQMVPKQIRLVSASAPLDTYAGTAFSLSPSPRSLPLPSFFSRKIDSGSDSEDEEATKNLRRLLRLD